MKSVATTLVCLTIGAQAADVARSSRDIWNSLNATQKQEVKTLIFDAMGQAKCLQFFSEFDEKHNEIMADEKDLDQFFNKQREFTAAEMEKAKVEIAKGLVENNVAAHNKADSELAKTDIKADKI